MSAAKGCLLWFHSPVEGVLGSGRPDDEKPDRPVLERYDLVRRKLDVIADPVSAYAVSGDGTRLVVRDRETLRVLRSDRTGSTAPEKGDADEFEIDTRRIVVTVDPTAEWRQMYDEAGRLMRDHFWDADMGGVDWAAELARYRPLVERVASRRPRRRAVGGARRARHLPRVRVRRRGGRRLPGRPGLLGADLDRTDDGWRVARVLPRETSAPDARSPAGRPGRRRAGRRRDPRGGRTTRRPRVGACPAAGRHRRTGRSS